MGSDCYILLLRCVIHVSIHAPTWGATPLRHLLTSSSVFQSTLPHGERLGFEQLWQFVLVVSIHAPTWGATLPTAHIVYKVKFQSTLPHGERHIAYNVAVDCTSFNPRSHMGSDLFPVRFFLCSCSFNPRSHMGSDIYP